MLGVEGGAKVLFIDEAKGGLAYVPEDAADLANKAMYLYNNREEAKTMGENGSKYVAVKFNRDTIAQNFYNEISRLA